MLTDNHLLFQLIKRYLYPKVYCISVPNKTDVAVYKKWGCHAAYIPHLVKRNDLTAPNTLDSKIVLNVGRLTSDKRQDMLIRMWSRINDHNGWKLLIVGNGEMKEELNRLIQELHVEESVELIPATSDINSIYRKTSVFCFTSRMEGFGMVLLEAMSFGIPCISFDCPSGPRDVIIDQYNGYLVENNNEKKFEVCLKHTMYLPSCELKQLGNNAYQTVLQWDNERILQSWRDVFKGDEI